MKYSLTTLGFVLLIFACQEKRVEFNSPFENESPLVIEQDPSGKDSQKQTTPLQQDTFINELARILQPYNGFYSDVEHNGVTLPYTALPESIYQYKSAIPNQIDLKSFQDIDNGYLLIFTNQYSTTDVLICSTLDAQYNIIDFKRFPLSKPAPTFNSLDTFIALSFSKKKIMLAYMHPNEFEEPYFEINGIKKDSLLFDEQLYFLR